MSADNNGLRQVVCSLSVVEIAALAVFLDTQMTLYGAARSSPELRGAQVKLLGQLRSALPAEALVVVDSGLKGFRDVVDKINSIL